jgi:predicted nuclease with TOPRIM domain
MRERQQETDMPSPHIAHDGLKARLQGWQADVERLSERRGEIDTSARIELQKALDTLRAEQARLEHMLRRAADAGEDAHQRAQHTALRMADKISTDIDRLKHDYLE